ncbi:MAG: hypothetical protein JNM07_09010 [Phycisphaerae bacterium]|nr:hypothetical protein [Phycisphaerae bacterium]
MKLPGSIAIWPAERFYWSLIEAHGLRACGPLPPDLYESLSQDIPETPAAIDHANALHAVCVPTSAGLLICAARGHELAGVPADTLCLRPDRVPLECDADPTRINLLVGPYEPRPIRRARWTRHGLGAATMLTCGLLISLGIHRRSVHEMERGTLLRQSEAALLASISPEMTSERLPAELDRLRRGATRAARPTPDATIALSELLKSWPTVAPCAPLSISVSESAMAVAVTVEKDATPFLQAFGAPGGWTLDEPRLNTSGDTIRLSLLLRPATRGEAIRSPGSDRGRSAPRSPATHIPLPGPAEDGP